MNRETRSASAASLILSTLNRASRADLIWVGATSLDRYSAFFHFQGVTYGKEEEKQNQGRRRNCRELGWYGTESEEESYEGARCESR
jgi:hypothetical protein